MAKGNPRRANGSRRTGMTRRLRAQGRPCWICGLPIDYSLPARDPLAFECDELVPVSRGGSPYDIGNAAASHRCCNNWRKARSVREVDAVRSLALSAFGPWSSPLEFVARARALKGRKAPAAPRGPLKVTTRW